MIININTLATAINEKRYVKPEEIEKDNSAFPGLFKKAVYHHEIYAGCIRDEKQVLNSFRLDLKNKKPVSITENNTRVFISFFDSNDKVFYELPIEYKERIEKGDI